MTYLEWALSRGIGDPSPEWIQAEDAWNAATREALRRIRAAIHAEPDKKSFSVLIETELEGMTTL